MQGVCLYRLSMTVYSLWSCCIIKCYAVKLFSLSKNSILQTFSKEGNDYLMCKLLKHLRSLDKRVVWYLQIELHCLHMSECSELNSILVIICGNFGSTTTFSSSVFSNIWMSIVVCAGDWGQPAAGGGDVWSSAGGHLPLCGYCGYGQHAHCYHG